MIIIDKEESGIDINNINFLNEYVNNIVKKGKYKIKFIKFNKNERYHIYRACGKKPLKFKKLDNNEILVELIKKKTLYEINDLCTIKDKFSKIEQKEYQEEYQEKLNIHNDFNNSPGLKPNICEASQRQEIQSPTPATECLHQQSRPLPREWPKQHAHFVREVVGDRCVLDNIHKDLYKIINDLKFKLYLHKFVCGFIFILYLKEKFNK